MALVNFEEEYEGGKIAQNVVRSQFGHMLISTWLLGVVLSTTSYFLGVLVDQVAKIYSRVTFVAEDLILMCMTLIAIDVTSTHEKLVVAHTVHSIQACVVGLLQKSNGDNDSNFLLAGVGSYTCTLEQTCRCELFASFRPSVKTSH